jgi:hypothetical protein
MSLSLTEGMDPEPGDLSSQVCKEIPGYPQVFQESWKFSNGLPQIHRVQILTGPDWPMRYGGIYSMGIWWGNLMKFRNPSLVFRGSLWGGNVIAWCLPILRAPRKPVCCLQAYTRKQSQQEPQLPTTPKLPTPSLNAQQERRGSEGEER